MFRVTAAAEHVPGSSPAALVRDGNTMVLVLAAGLVAPEVIRHLDVLLRTAIGPLVDAAAVVGDSLLYGVG